MIETIPFGQTTPQIKQSNGGDSDVLKFYCTTSAVAYSAPRGKFNELKARNVADWDRAYKDSGFVNNMRPVIGYSPALDDVDNPIIKDGLMSNYLTMTKKDFKPYDHLKGDEPFSHYERVVSESGFDRNPPPPPISNFGKYPFVDQTLHTQKSPADWERHPVPLLHRTKLLKDPVASDNYFHGPAAARTEYKSTYIPKGKNAEKSLFPIDMGKKEATGHVNNQAGEPITFSDPTPFASDSLRNYFRPTGESMMKTHYRRLTRPDGTEPFVAARPTAERGSGFHSLKAVPPASNTEGYDYLEQLPELRAQHVKQGDPAEYMNLTNPNNKSSVTALCYKGLQNPEQTEADRLHNVDVGRLEPSGAVLNTLPSVPQPDEAATRFRTEYKGRFVDNTPVGAEREGHVRGGTFTPLANSFTRSTVSHARTLAFEDWEPRKFIANGEPYQTRARLATDTYFNQEPHSHKQH